MSSFSTLFVFSFLLSIFCAIANAANPPPLEVTATYAFLTGTDFWVESSFEDRTVEIYPTVDDSLDPVNPLFKTAKIHIKNIHATESIQLAAVLTAGPVYNASNAETESTTAINPPKVLKLYDVGSPDASILFTLAPSESKELTFQYANCDDPFIMNALITIQAVSVSSSVIYDPVDAVLKLECTEESCGSDCDGTDYGENSGSCIKEIGYCLCKNGWLGKECNYKVNLSDSICPGEPIRMSLLFSSSQCDGYVSVSEAESLQSIFYVDLPRDNCSLSRPYPLSGNQIQVNLSAYLQPGTYMIYVYQQYGKQPVAIIPINVREWGSCNYTYDCRNVTKNSCSNAGTCEEDGSCTCSDSHFWNDCSGGCSKTVNLTEKTGVIDTDPLAQSYGRDSVYVEYASCTWIVSPPGADIIDLDFVSFNLDGGSDYLSIRKVGKNGVIDLNDNPLYKMTGTKYPAKLSIPYEKIALVFESDYSVSASGFRINYSSRKAPLAGKYIAAIAICASFLVIAIVGLALFFSIRNKKKRDEELAAALQATSIPWVLSESEDEVESAAKENVRLARLKLNDIYGGDDEDDSNGEESEDEITVMEEATDTSANPSSSKRGKNAPPKEEEEEKKSDKSGDAETEKKDKRREAGLDREAFVKSVTETDEELGWLDLGCLGIECDQHWPRFGLEQGATCPIMEDLKTKITLKNSSDSPISYCFFHPVDDEKFSLSLCPGRGTIPADASVTITMNFRLFYTTFVFEHVKLAIYKAGNVRGMF